MFNADPKNETGKVVPLNKLPKYRVIWEDDSSLENWVEQFKLECAPKTEWGYFGSLYFESVYFGSVYFECV